MDWFTEVVAWTALTFLWIQLALMAAADLKQAQDLSRMASRWRGAARGHFDGQAQHLVDQVGRSKGDGQIHFHDRGYDLRTEDAAVTVAGERLELDGLTGLWFDEKRLRGAASTVEGDWEQAYARAQKPKGFRRVFEAFVLAGSEVWVLGSQIGARLEPVDAALEIATIDPVAWCQRKRNIVRLAVAAQVVVGIALSVAILWPPRFGAVSTAGAALGLVYFLAIQQLGKTLRDLVRPPPRAIVRGNWSRPPQD